MNKKLTSRIAGGVALASAAALALALAAAAAARRPVAARRHDHPQARRRRLRHRPEQRQRQVLGTIVTAFEAAHSNIKVNVTSIPWTNFDPQVQTMVQNKQYPDITEGDYFSNYAQDGLLYSGLGRAVEPGRTCCRRSRRRAPTTAPSTACRSPPRAGPCSTTRSCSRRRASASAPQTWADVQADAAKITKLGNVGFGLPLGAEEAQAESLLWMLGDGGGYQTAGKYTINSPANVAAFTFLKGLVAAGDTEPNPGTVNRTDAVGAVRAGQGRHDQRLARAHPDHPVGRRPASPPTGPRSRSRARPAR